MVLLLINCILNLILKTLLALGTYQNKGSRWEYGPRPSGPKEIDGLLVSPGKASTLLTDLISG